MIDIQRSKNDPRLACRAASLFGQSGQRVCQKMPSGDSARIGQACSQSAHHSIRRCIGGQLVERNQPAHMFGQLFVDPAFGFFSNGAQIIAFEPSDGTNRLEQRLQ